MNTILTLSTSFTVLPHSSNSILAISTLPPYAAKVRAVSPSCVQKGEAPDSAPGDHHMCTPRASATACVWLHQWETDVCSSHFECMWTCNTYRIRFNFHGVKLSQIASLHDFRIFIFADHGYLQFSHLLLPPSLCHWCLKPSQIWDILPFGDQKRTNEHPSWRNDPVTAHMWTYKRFLSQVRFRWVWYQWRVIICIGISSCICSPLCWFVKVIVRASPFFQHTSQAKFSLGETFADGRWSAKTAKV